MSGAKDQAVVKAQNGQEGEGNPWWQDGMVLGEHADRCEQKGSLSPVLG